MISANSICVKAASILSLAVIIGDITPPLLTAALGPFLGLIGLFALGHGMILKITPFISPKVVQPFKIKDLSCVWHKNQKLSFMYPASSQLFHFCFILFSRQSAGSRCLVRISKDINWWQGVYVSWEYVSQITCFTNRLPACNVLNSFPAAPAPPQPNRSHLCSFSSGGL